MDIRLRGLIVDKDIYTYIESELEKLTIQIDEYRKINKKYDILLDEIYGDFNCILFAIDNM